MHARDGLTFRPSSRLGDSANEHLQIRRSGYSAWGYVLLAAFTQWLVAAAGIAVVAERLHVETNAVLLASLAGGVGVVVATFWNRWRVIEAFASRSCTGLANISIVTATVMALGYANVRFVLRLVGREARVAGR